MSDKAKKKNIKQAAIKSAQSLPSSCTTVCSTLNCQKPLPREDTEKILNESIKRNRDAGANELDAMVNAIEEALEDGASVEDILDQFSTKSWVDFSWRKKEAPIKMGADTNKGIKSGLDSSIDDDTENQMGHIMAYVRYGYKFGGYIARKANEWHDPIDEWKPKGSKEAKETGVTKEDYDAGLRGASIGERLKSGTFCLEEFPDILKKELGLGGEEIQNQNIKNEFDKPYLDRGLPPPAPLPMPEE